MKRKLIITAVVLVVAAAVIFKIWFFPSVKDDYFTMDERGLQKVPAGMLVVRPTHFAFLKDKGNLRTVPRSGAKNFFWQMGRNAPLHDVMAAAYQWSPLRVVMPPDATTGRFDYLMTGTSNQLADFQTLIHRKLGYLAKVEARTGDVLALKIANPSSPAVTASGADEKRRISLNGDKLHFQHVPLGILVGVFGHLVGVPMLDKTGATNLYDFTMEWNSKTDSSYNAGTLPRDRVEQIINSLGLKLEPDTAPLDMLVVSKAN